MTMHGTITEFEHEGTVQPNAPLVWKLKGNDGNYVATVSGGNAELRQQAIDKAFTDLGHFSETFRGALKHSHISDANQPSYFTLSSPVPAEHELEACLHITYHPCAGNAQRDWVGGLSKREEMRGFIEQCLGIEAPKRGSGHAV